eukprot:2250947-Amphidinium_carterae.1
MNLKEDLATGAGFDAVIVGNIPGVHNPLKIDLSSTNLSCEFHDSLTLCWHMRLRQDVGLTWQPRTCLLGLFVLHALQGGGMSRSASLIVNLMLTTLELNGRSLPEGDFRRGASSVLADMEVEQISCQLASARAFGCKFFSLVKCFDLEHPLFDTELPGSLVQNTQSKTNINTC